jgi:prophage regulatory protein
MQHGTPFNNKQVRRPREAAARLGFSLQTMWRLRRRGEFPEPIRLSPGAVGWTDEVLDAWLEQRASSGAVGR